MSKPNLFKLKADIADDTYKPTGFADEAFLKHLAADIAGCSLVPLDRRLVAEPDVAGADCVENDDG